MVKEENERVVAVARLAEKEEHEESEDDSDIDEIVGMESEADDNGEE